MNDTELTRQYHEVANIFPLIQGEEFEALKSDIKQNGLLEPIWLHPDGRIIDGRNRHRACIETSTQMKFKTWNGSGSLVSFVVSLNLHRRHLSSSQKAAVAVEILPILEAEAKQRQGERTDLHNDIVEIFPQCDGGRARDIAAEITGTNGRYVSEAKKLKEEAPELFEAVQAGEMTIPQAKREVIKKDAEALRVEPIKPPQGKYSTIVVDPPWPMEKLERNVRPNQFAFDYPTMSIEEICAFDVVINSAADDCHLFLWSTQKHLPHSFSILNAWGFRYVFTMVWHKSGGFQPYNLPQYNCEFVVYARKGTPKFLETKAFSTAFEAPRAGHSVKPSEFYDLLNRVTPSPRIEIFSRNNRDGFSSWGNEV